MKPGRDFLLSLCKKLKNISVIIYSTSFCSKPFCISLHIQLKSKVCIHLAESAKCWLFYREHFLNRMMMSIFLVLSKYHFFSFSTALQKLQKTVTSSNSKSFHTLALNAWFLLLEHQWVFESSVIVAYESLSCPRCENMDLKIIQSLLERVQIHKHAGKPKNLCELKDFSEEQQTV